MSASFFSFSSFLPWGGGGYRHDDFSDDFDSTRLTMRILGSFCSLLCFDLQVLGKKKLLPCQVGGEFLFALVVDGRNLAARSVLLHRARLPGPPVGIFVRAIYGVLFLPFVFARKPGGVFLSRVFLVRPSGCFSVRGSGFFFGLFSGFRGRVCFSFFFVVLSCFLHLSCVGKEHRRHAGRNGA